MFSFNTNLLYFLVYIFTAAIIYSGSPFLLLFLETLFPLNNGSYPIIVSGRSEYIFFEEFDHYYFTCFHTLISVMYMECLYAGVDTVYLCTVQHAAALFLIVR